MSPSGSTWALIARSSSTPASPTSPVIQGAWSRPTEWWWVIVASVSTSACVAAALAAFHWATGSSASGVITVKYRLAPVG
jgi:hypothetical protein